MVGHRIRERDVPRKKDKMLKVSKFLKDKGVISPVKEEPVAPKKTAKKKGFIKKILGN